MSTDDLIYTTHSGARPVLDERDRAIIDARAESLATVQGPRVGDWVEFADGITRRVSHVWDFDDDALSGVQTSNGGSFYLGEGFVSFSGNLYQSVRPSTLTRTEETRLGRVWIFHHDWAEAHNGVDTSILFRVYKSTAKAPR
jgi:hypothetical protein